jgi:DNA-binding MarR family transcriptional regulator
MKSVELPTPDKVQAWRALMHVHASVTNAIDLTLQANLGIPGTWYEALVEIAFAGGSMRMQEFATETTLTKSGATRFVDRLERAGLVERKSCPTDRRVYQLTLTAKGKKLQQAADPHVLRVLEETFGRYISDDEAGVILNALRRAHMAPAGVEPAAI